MAGQMIVLPGVTAAAGASAPRVNMNVPDTLAARISTLKHVVSARSLQAIAGGGVSGRCRASGAALVPKGISASTLTLYEVAGRTAMGINGSGRAALALPTGSLTKSFTTVSVINLNSVDVAGNYSVNILSGFDAADAYTNIMLRYDGSSTTNSAIADKLRASTSGSSSSAVPVARPAGEWVVVVTDYNNLTKTMSVAANQATTFSTGVMAAELVPAAGSYLEIGYHLDPSSLRASKVGDLYTFSDSMLRTDLGRTQLAELVAALKTYYTIV